MIKEYWESKPNHKENPFTNPKKRSRPSSGKASKKDKVPSAEELENKRRQAKVASVAEVNRVADPNTDDEDAPPRPKKKPRTDALSNSSTSKSKKERSPSSDLHAKLSKKLSAKKTAIKSDDDDDDEHNVVDGPAAAEQNHLGNMEKYRAMKSWENMVKTIQTVEKAEDDSLKVYFVMCASLVHFVHLLHYRLTNFV